MIEYLILVLAVPLGILLAKTTQDESQIYKKPKYFPTIEKTLLALLAIFISQDKQIALTLAFILITTYAWHKT